MKTKQTVYNALFAGQKAEKVDLSALSEIKDMEKAVIAKTNKAHSGLDSAISALNAALKETHNALNKTRKAQAVAKDLGVDEGQFNGWEKQFANWRDDLEMIISKIQKVQNSI